MTEQPPGPPIDPSLGPRQRAAAAAAAAGATGGSAPSTTPWYRRPVVVVAAVVALVVVVALVAFALTRDSSDEGSPAPQQSTPAGAAAEAFVVLVPQQQTDVAAVAELIGCGETGSVPVVPEGASGGAACRLDDVETVVFKFKDAAALQAWAGTFPADKVSGAGQGGTVAVAAGDAKTAAAVRDSLDL